MKALVWFSALAALAIGAALLLRYNEGEVIFNFPTYRIFIRLNLFVILIAALFAILYGLLRLSKLLRTLPGKMHNRQLSLRKDKADNALVDALRYFYEGHYNQALKSAEQAHQTGDAPKIAALIAAQAAHRLHDTKKQNDWFDEASGNDTELAAAVQMQKAWILLEDQRFDEALAVLEQLEKTEGRYPELMILELKARQGARQWDGALHLIEQLERVDALPTEVAARFKRDFLMGELEKLRADPDALRDWLRKVSEIEQDPAFARFVAAALIEARLWKEARELIEKTLEKHWDSELLLLYAHCPSDDSDEAALERAARIANAEKWLDAHRQDAALLYALGRLCHIERLWGKAKGYFEASLSFKPDARTHLALAVLADELGEKEEAERHFRASALASLPEHDWKYLIAD